MGGWDGPLASKYPTAEPENVGSPVRLKKPRGLASSRAQMTSKGSVFGGLTSSWAEGP